MLTISVINLRLLLLLLMYRLWIFKKAHVLKKCPFSSNILKSDSKRASQCVCITIAVSFGDHCSGWKMWSNAAQWLCASMPRVQDPLPTVGPWCSRPVDLGALYSNPLCLSGLALSSRSVVLFAFPFLHLTLEEITPHPSCLIAIKGTLRRLFNFLGSYKRQREFMSWSSSCFPLSFLYKFPFSFRNLLKTLVSGQPAPPFLCFYILFCLFVVVYNSTFDFNVVSGGTKSKLGTCSTNKNFHC